MQPPHLFGCGSPLLLQCPWHNLLTTLVPNNEGCLDYFALYPIKRLVLKPMILSSEIRHTYRQNAVLAQSLHLPVAEDWTIDRCRRATSYLLTLAQAFENHLRLAPQELISLSIKLRLM